MAAAELDVSLRGVEVGVSRNDVPLVEQGREDDVLGGTSLVRGQEVGHAEEPLDDRLEAEVGRGARVALVAGHHRRPLAVGHRAGARVGQQVDRNLVRTQFEEVVVRFADPGFAFGACRGADRLGHLDLVGFAIGKFHAYGVLGYGFSVLVKFTKKIGGRDEIRVKICYPVCRIRYVACAGRAAVPKPSERAGL